MPVDRHQLHFGPYCAPAFRYGEKVLCERHGQVTIYKLTNGRIPWPVGKTPKHGRSLVLFGDLVRAIKREAACAVAYWWGVGPFTVWQWRRAMGVKRTIGDTLLLTAYGKRPEHRHAILAMVSKARDPKRRSKIAAAKRGKPRPQAVMEALQKANRGRKLSAEHRQKLSVIRKQKGIRPPWLNDPWSDREDKLCRTLPPADVVKQTGRTLSAVYERRSVLGVNNGRTTRHEKVHRKH